MRTTGKKKAVAQRPQLQLIRATATVTSIAEHKTRDTEAVLTVLLEQVRQGRLNGGIAVVAMNEDGEEDMFFTGEFRKGRDPAISVLSRMWARLVQISGGRGTLLRK